MIDKKLPAGKVCFECAHWHWCSDLIFTLKAESTTCQWLPNKFEALTVETEPKIGKSEIENLCIDGVVVKTTLFDGNGRPVLIFKPTMPCGVKAVRG